MEELDTEAKNGYHYRAHIVHCGGVMTIIRAMEMNANCEGIQIPCCLTLEKLALDPQTQVAICEMEGISLVVRSMQDHVDNAQVQEAACVALSTICRHQEAETSQDPMKNAEGAVPTLLSCMTKYPTNSLIQAKAFNAITSLCTGSHSHRRLAELSKAGGIMTLTMALQTPWENKHDQHEAISNLSILLRGITELNENLSSFPTEEEISKVTKQDETSRTSTETGSMSTKLDESEKAKGHESTTEKPDNEIDNGEAAAGDDDESHGSYIEEIPDIPIMTSRSSLKFEEIPDLGQFPTMMSNLEWQNNECNDPDSANKKKSTDTISPSRTGVRPQQLDGRKEDKEEQCTIQ